jgi:exo-beta-1,3-glucanase (GH17 family)
MYRFKFKSIFLVLTIFVVSFSLIFFNGNIVLASDQTESMPPESFSSLSVASQRYALLLSGGVNLIENDKSFKNDLSFVYDTLVNYYKFEEDHVISIYFDGNSQDLDGDGDNDIDYAATKANFNTAFNFIKTSLGEEDLFFIFATDHGTQYESPEAEDEDGIDEGICLWDSDGDGLELDEVILDNELATLASGTPGTLIFVLQQCFSGGLISDLSASNRIIMTSCLEEESAHGANIDSMGYDFFSYHWTVAVQGFSADNNSDGQISMQEAFDYAIANDEAYSPIEYESEETETCQIDDPSNIAGTTTLGDRTRVSILPVADSFVNSAQPDTNFGDEDHLSADITSGTDRVYNYSYIMFDLSLLPSNSILQSANLNLFAWQFQYQVSSPGPQIYSHYCSDNSWTELEITWNNKPTFDPLATSYIDPPMLGYNSWNVTKDAVNALSSGNLTEVLKWPDYSLSSNWAWIEFRSREEFYFNSQLLRGFKPKLTVEYSIQPPLKLAYLVVRGSDNGIYCRAYNSSEESWGNWIALPGSTPDTPAAAVCGDNLHIVVRGMDVNSLYHGFINLLTEEFSGWSWMSGSTPSIPRLVSDENSLYLVVRGDDNRIYLRSYDLISESWGDWNAVPTGSTMDAPGAAVDGDYLHLVVRGMDNGLYHQRVYLPTLDYLGWSGIGGTTPSSPTLTRNYNSEGDDHSLYLIVRGSDDGIYLRSYDGSWDSWTKLSGGTNDAVGTCVAPSLPDPEARLHVVVRGINGAMYHGKYDLNSESFLGWNWINGETPSPPTLTNPFTPVKIYGLNFGPYIKEGQNPDLGTVIGEEQIRELMTTIKPYTKWVRTFGCSNGLEVAGRIAHELGLKIAVGAWLGPNSYANDKEIDNLIDVAEAGQADMLIVGSEVLLRGDLSESQLIGYINEVKNAIPYLPVATADIYGELLAHPEVMAAGDVVLPNFYPYWEGISIDNAMSFLHHRYNQIAEAAGDRPVIVSEAGWPSAGNQLGDAVPSAENAAFFFLNFESWAKAEGISSFYFEAFDEPWKVANEGNVGAHWGVWNNDGYLKTGMVDVFYGKTVPDNWSGDDTPGGPGEPLTEFSYASSPW